MKTDGTSASWATVTALPTQSSSNNGQYLKTDGTSASWAAVTVLPTQTSSNSGQYLKADGTGGLVWSSVSASGGPSWNDINIKNISVGSLNNEQYNTRFGAMYGKRYDLYWIDDHHFVSARRQDEYNSNFMNLFNGQYRLETTQNSPVTDATGVKYFGIGGYLDITPKEDNVRYNYGMIGFTFQSRFSGNDYQVKVSLYGTNDNMNFHHLFTKGMNEFFITVDSTTQYVGWNFQHAWASPVARPNGEQVWLQVPEAKVSYYRKYRIQFSNWQTFETINFHAEGRFANNELQEIEFAPWKAEDFNP